MSNPTESRQVRWFPVFEYVTQRVAQIESWPAAGTPAWERLPDDDPRKLHAVLVAGVHWSLRVDALQEGQVAAAENIRDAEDWKRFAQVHLQRESFYENRPWLKRRTA